MNEFQILKYALATEKAVRTMESQNVIMFVVDSKANKNQIKKAFETLFKTKASKVRIVNDRKGRKKAYITLPKDQFALDVATKLGII